MSKRGLWLCAPKQEKTRTRHPSTALALRDVRHVRHVLHARQSLWSPFRLRTDQSSHRLSRSCGFERFVSFECSYACQKVFFRNGLDVSIVFLLLLLLLLMVVVMGVGSSVWEPAVRHLGEGERRERASERAGERARVREKSQPASKASKRASERTERAFVFLSGSFYKLGVESRRRPMRHHAWPKAQFSRLPSGPTRVGRHLIGGHTRQRTPYRLDPGVVLIQSFRCLLYSSMDISIGVIGGVYIIHTHTYIYIFLYFYILHFYVLAPEHFCLIKSGI